MVFSPTSCQTSSTKHVGTRRVLRLRLSRSDGSWVWNSERLQQQALRQWAFEVHTQQNIFDYVENYRWSSAYEQFVLTNTPHILLNRDWHPIQRTCKLMNDIYWIYCRSRITITAPNIWLPGPLVRLFLSSSSLHFLYCTDLFLILSVLHLHLATLRSFFCFVIAALALTNAWTLQLSLFLTKQYNLNFRTFSLRSRLQAFIKFVKLVSTCTCVLQKTATWNEIKHYST